MFFALSPLSNSAFAYEEDQTVCIQIKYKHTIYSRDGDTTEEKVDAICGKVTADGKIKSDLSMGKSEIPETVLGIEANGDSRSKDSYGNATGNPPHVFLFYRTEGTSGTGSMQKCLAGDPTGFRDRDTCPESYLKYTVGLTTISELVESIERSLNANRKNPEVVTYDTQYYDQAKVKDKQIWNKVGNVAIITDASEVTNLATNPDGSDPEDVCSHNLSLGWIICPILKGLSQATASMYEDIVEPFLNINAGSLFDPNSGVFKAWQIFQNIANILLIIFILVIVFSQLTGIGIDNYGIKKALPKLIITIVLINLSYIICQLAVDISNVLGYSLRNLFEGLVTAIPANYSSAGTSILPTIATASLGAGAIAGAVGIMMSPLAGAALIAIVPALIAGLIAAVVAILFFFIILGIRQAGVVILIVIAPLAFVCFMLPNTKSLFDKWIKAFKALILVYPIAGVVMGGGTFASVLLMNANPNGGFWFALVSLLVQVVPFFFIPTILKSSLSALGNIGAMVAGAGSRMGRRLGGGAGRLAGAGLRSSKRLAALNSKNNERYANRKLSKLDKIKQAVANKDGADIRQNVEKGLKEQEKKNITERMQQEEGNKIKEQLLGGRNYDELSQAEKDQFDADYSKQYNSKIASQDFKDRIDNAYNKSIGSAEFASKINTGVNNEIRKRAIDQFGEANMLKTADYVNQAAKHREEVGAAAAIAGFAGGATGYLAARGAQSATNAAIAAEGLSNYNKQYIQKNDGTTYAQRSDGSYVNSQGEVITSAEAKQLVANGEAKTVSYAEAQVNQAAEVQAKQVGAMGAYANKTKVEQSANATLASALNSSVDSLDGSILEGDGSVLKLRHDQTLDKQVQLKAQADVGVEVTEADVALRNAQNARNLAAAKNDIDITPEITSTYAKSLEAERYDTSQQKIYGESFKNQTRKDVVDRFEEFLSRAGEYASDKNYGIALMDDIVAKGGYEDLMNKIYNMETAKVDPNALSAIYNKMATLSEPAMKQYGKYRVAMQAIGAEKPEEISSFADWVDGKNVKTTYGGKTIEASKASLKGYNDANGINALVDASKDTFGFYASHPEAVSSSSVINGVISSSNNDARLAGEKLLSEKLKNSSIQEKTTLLGQLNNSQWSKMQDSTLKTILKMSPDTDLSQASIPNEFANFFTELKQKINDPNNASVFAHMSSGIRDFINRAKDSQGNNSGFQFWT